MATKRTAAPQTPEAKALNAARSRTLTAAKKSLGLIAEAVAKHQADLEAGTVPDSAFTASVLKYEALRSVLDALGKLAGGEPVVPEPEVPAPARQEDAAATAQLREDVAVLIQVLAELAPELQPVKGYPLYRLREFAIPGGAGPAANGQQDEPQQVTEALTGDGTDEVAAALAGDDSDEPPY